MHAKCFLPQWIRKQKCRWTKSTLQIRCTARIINYLLYDTAQLCWYLCTKNARASLSSHTVQIASVKRPRSSCFEFQRLTLEKPLSSSFYCADFILIIFIGTKLLSTLHFLPNVVFLFERTSKTSNRLMKLTGFLVFCLKRLYCHLCTNLPVTFFQLFQLLQYFG